MQIYVHCNFGLARNVKSAPQHIDIDINTSSNSLGHLKINGTDIADFCQSDVVRYVVKGIQSVAQLLKVVNGTPDIIKRKAGIFKQQPSQERG